jgi:hypothetical protein
MINSESEYYTVLNLYNQILYNMTMAGYDIEDLETDADYLNELAAVMGEWELKKEYLKEVEMLVNPNADREGDDNGSHE